MSAKKRWIIGGAAMGAVIVGGSAIVLLLSPKAPAPAHTYHDPAELTIEVVPYLDQAHLVAVWAPMVSYLSEQTGRPVHLQIADSFESLPTDLATNHASLAYGSDISYIVAHDNAGYLPLAADILPIAGMIIVRQDSPLRDGADASALRGKRIAIPSQNASPYLFARGWALTHGGLHLDTDTQVQTLNGLDAVTRAVLSGSADAGVTFPPYFNALPLATRSQLRVLIETEHYPAPPIMVDPNLAPALTAKLQHALLALDTAGRRAPALLSLSWQGTVSEGDAEFNGVRALAVRLGIPY